MRIHQRLIREESGQGLAEYIIVVALVAIAAIGAISLFGSNVQAVFATATATLNGKSAKTDDYGSKDGKQGEQRSLGDFGERK